MPFYAVAQGHQPGIYTSWPECELQVKRYSKAVFKKFKTRIEAEQFLKTAREKAEYGVTGELAKNFWTGRKQPMQCPDYIPLVYTDDVPTTSKAATKAETASVGSIYNNVPPPPRASINYREDKDDEVPPPPPKANNTVLRTYVVGTVNEQENSECGATGDLAKRCWRGRKQPVLCLDYIPLECDSDARKNNELRDDNEPPPPPPPRATVSKTYKEDTSDDEIPPPPPRSTMVIPKTFKEETADKVISSITLTHEEELQKDDPSMSFDENDEVMWLALDALDDYGDECISNTNKRKRDEPTTSNPAAKRLKIGSYTFNVSEDGFTHAYIGEHAENVGQWNCVAGYGVYFDDNHPLNTSKAATGKISRNIGVIEAAIYAITTAKDSGIQKLKIITKSDFLLNAISSLIFYWKRNGWRTQAGKVVANKKELQKLDTLLTNENIQVKWQNATDAAYAHKAMRTVHKLAQSGAEDYVDLHPKKDSDRFDESFDFPF